MINAPHSLRLSATVALAVSLVASACQGESSSTADDDPITGIHVVASTTILGDLLGTLVGSDGTVEVLAQEGIDPHDLALSVSQVSGLRDADLVVVNGLGLEAALEDVLADAVTDGVRVEELADELDPLEAGEDQGDHDVHADHDDGHDDDDDEDGHEHGDEDPHVWLDPVRMATGATLLAGWLAEVDDTLGDDEWTARGQALSDAILAAHDEVEAALAAVPEQCRVLVTNHDAFNYFAQRYDFEVVGTVIPGTSTQAGSSAGDLAELIDVIQERNVPALFAETTESTQLAEALAEDLDRPIEIVQLYSGALGPVGSGAEDYTGMLVTNARLIADALAGCDA